MIEIFLGAFVLFTPGTWNMITAPTSQELELSIRTDKSSYAVGDTISLEITLRNTGSQTLNVLKYFMVPADDPNKNNLEIHVYDAAGNRLSRISHVLTGRLDYYPDRQSIEAGETYSYSILLAGTFAGRDGRKRIKRALWSLGEDPEQTYASEYPVVTKGSFKVQVIYLVDQKQLIGLSEVESSSVWKGRLISNVVELSLK